MAHYSEKISFIKMINPAKVEIIEHAADLGLMITASQLQDIFIKAAAAVLEYAVREKPEKLLRRPGLDVEERVLVLEEDSWEEVLLRWLNEQLYNLYTYNILAVDYSLLLEEGAKNRLSAKTRYIKISAEDISSEVKSATRHHLKVEKTPAGYRANVIFDL